MSDGFSEVYLKGCIGVATKTGTSLCARGMMCPKCESRRAQRRGSQLMKKLAAEMTIAEESGWSAPDVGVLTVTIPGKNSSIRHADLQSQYDYVTERVTLPSLTGWHSMRGLNKLLDMLGVHGGCHNLEFTWSEKNGWWNTHIHTIVVGYGLQTKVSPDGQTSLGEFEKHGWKETARFGFDADREWEWDKNSDHGGWNDDLAKFGFGRRYSLDWAQPHEIEALVRYSAKVAYVTKPIKAPKDKRGELVRFFLNSPRLSRPIGDWRRTFFIEAPE